MATAYYFDSGVFVTPIIKNRDPKVIGDCLSWQQRLQRAEIVGYTSYLTWDEVVYIAARASGAYDRTIATKAGDLFLSLPNLTFVPIDNHTVRGAQALLPHGLRPRDSIHASSSLIHAGGNFVSLDIDFRSKAPDLGLTLHEIR